MTEEERAKECKKEIEDVLKKYGFDLSGDWDGEPYLRDDKTDKTYSFMELDLN